MGKWYKGKYNANYRYKSKNALGDGVLDMILYPIFIAALVILFSPLILLSLIVWGIVSLFDKEKGD